jgi:hypothetical protein
VRGKDIREAGASRLADESLDDPALLELAAAIADGQPFDPAVVGGPANSPLSHLQVIARLADVHRHVPDPAASGSLGDLLSLFPSRPRPDLSKAKPWGPLLILEDVGYGSFGAVSRAWYPSLDHEVALKRLRFPAGSPARLSAVVREGQLLARVRHPNVITVHGACEVGDEIGIWMEFVRGRTLEHLVQDDGPMSASEACIVGESLCRALAAVHHAGILHRDLKAANVMREEGGRIVLLDFGTGGDLAFADATGARLVGTPLYMAPELFTGAAATVQSDIYALGVLLFYLTTGSFPVNGRTLADVRAAHLAGRRRHLSDVRPDLAASFLHVVERATAADPEQRYASAGAMLRDLTDSQTAERPVSRGIPGLAALLVAVIAIPALVGILGFVTSAAFRLHIGLSPQTSVEGPLDVFKWGAMNLVPTLFYMGLAVLAFHTLGAVKNVALKFVPPLRRPATRIASAWRSWQYTSGLNDLDTTARAWCVTGALTLLGICVAFRELIQGFTSGISDAPMATLAVLHPSRLSTHVFYGIAMDMMVLAMLVGLIRIVRRSRTNSEPLPTGPVIGLVTLACLSLCFHAMAWRIIYMDRFSQVIVADQTCYAIGQNQDNVLVHCPQSAPPRNRLVSRNATTITPTGIEEEISTAFVVNSVQTPRSISVREVR